MHKYALCEVMNFGTQLKKLRVAAGRTVDQAAKEQGISRRLWSYWEANQKLPPCEGDAITRERLLARWKTKNAPADRTPR